MGPSALVLVVLVLGAEPPVAPALAYDQVVANLAADRVKLAAGYRKAKKPADRSAIVMQARERLLAAIDHDLLPAWFGTSWEFYGHTERPNDGAIACGYLVSTVLRDAGFRIERVLVAQQASEYIVRTLTPADRVKRYQHKSNEELVELVTRELGEGLYVVGFDFHVGFLRVDSAGARFCHSSYLGKRVVVCEPPESSGAFSSTLHVVGNALEDERIVDWLAQRYIPTKRPARK